MPPTTFRTGHVRLRCRHTIFLRSALLQQQLVVLVDSVVVGETVMSRSMISSVVRADGRSFFVNMKEKNVVGVLYDHFGTRPGEEGGRGRKEAWIYKDPRGEDILGEDCGGREGGGLSSRGV
ncbi:hypothetical protein RUND412_011514 [Rhizina undulata]